jgi:hypothetical protein
MTVFAKQALEFFKPQARLSAAAATESAQFNVEINLAI